MFHNKIYRPNSSLFNGTIVYWVNEEGYNEIVFFKEYIDSTNNAIIVCNYTTSIDEKEVSITTLAIIGRDN